MLPHDVIGQQVAAWLRRVYPRAGAKTAARDFDASPHTTRRWFEGQMPANKHLTMMLKRWGKPFIVFITEPAVGPWPELEHAAGQGDVAPVVRAVLGELGYRSTAVRTFWCTGAGEITEASAGHAEMARRAMGVPAYLEMDSGQYMRRNHGWAALARAADGAVTVHYSERRLPPAAAAAICEWIAQGPVPAAITRVVDLGVSEIRARHDRTAAIEAIEKAGTITASGKARSWTVRRLPLERAEEPAFTALISAWHQSPGDMVAAAAAIDGFKATSVFRIDDAGDVWSQIVGSSFGLPVRQLEGRRVLERGDTAYGAMIAERVKQSATEPTLHDLTGSVGGYPCKYRNLTLPELGTGRVVSASRVLERA